MTVVLPVLHLGNPVGRLEDLARLGAIRRADDAVALHQVDEVGSASVANAQAALQQGSGCLAELQHQSHRVVKERIVVALARVPRAVVFYAVAFIFGAARKPCSYCAVACAFQNSTVEAISFSVTKGACTRSTREEPLGR